VVSIGDGKVTPFWEARWLMGASPKELAPNLYLLESDLQIGKPVNPRPDRGRLPCMAVGPLSRSATIKGGQAGAREPTFIVPTVPPQTLTT
jgi:hypothetical protein